MQFFIHYFLHLVLPGIVAYAFYRPRWGRVCLVWLATMAVDVDHLFANPIYDACRCSINYHLLHSYYAIAVYVLLLFFKPTRLIAIGLLWHMATDGIDCYMSSFHCL
ncbi:MAG: hypothetical protein EOP51_01960 [Sphingobacteriales bacterium]|nr:MAG: hypothetical protein EOP51_01960 [Sphingobacteriales bacterium]